MNSTICASCSMPRTVPSGYTQSNSILACPPPSSVPSIALSPFVKCKRALISSNNTGSWICSIALVHSQLAQLFRDHLGLPLSAFRVLFPQCRAPDLNAIVQTNDHRITGDSAVLFQIIRHQNTSELIDLAVHGTRNHCAHKASRF